MRADRAAATDGGTATRHATDRDAARHPRDLLALQRSIGNRSVAALVGAARVQRAPDEHSDARSDAAPPQQQRRRRRGVPLLRVGSRGPVVEGLQRRLGVTADGIFGGRTRAAVVAFQRDAGLTPDGLVGPATLAALRGGAGAGPAPGDVAAAVVARLRAIGARLQQLDAEAAAIPVAEPAPESEPAVQPARNDFWDDAEEWWDETSETAGEVWDETTEAAGEAAEWVEETAEEAWDEATEAAGEAADWAEETADEAVEWVEETAEDVWDTTTEAAGDAADWVEETAGGAAEWVVETAEDVWDTTTDVAEQVWDTTVELAGDVADAVESAVGFVMDDVLPAIGDAVGELIDDPIGVLSDLADRVRDGLANGFGSNILEELEEAWNKLFGGDEDEAETSSSGDIPAVGPSTLPRSCPKSDGPVGRRPATVRIHVDWRPSEPLQGGVGAAAPAERALRDDRLAAGLVFRGSIAQTLPISSVVQFGRAEPSLVVESIQCDQDDDVVDVRGVVRLDCRWNVKSHGRIDVPGADSPVVTEGTWLDIVVDLTPGPGDQPPRSTYWASDIVGEHERYHGVEDVLHARSMVDDGSAIRGIDGRPIVDPEEELPKIMAEIHQRIMTYMQDQYLDGGEGRAYGATAHLYRRRVEQIQTRAEREGWTGGT